jgi:hypothetical protein
MRVFRLRQPAALALLGVALSGVLVGCGKGSNGTSGGSRTASSGFGAAPQARGVLGVATKNTTRLGGADPASDAAAVAEAVYPGFTPATRPQAVVLVDEHDFSAALASSALASAPLGAPLLYAEGDSLPEVSKQALEAMRPIGASALGGAQVIRVGTAAALPDGLRARDVTPSSGTGVPASGTGTGSTGAGTGSTTGTAAPTGAGTTTGGAASSTEEDEPAALAAAVAQLAETLAGKPARNVLVVASDSSQALQMPAASLAAESRAPILFVTSADVPVATREALRSLRHPTIYVVAPTTLHASAYAALKQLGTVVHVSGGAGAEVSASAGASSNPIDNAISVSRFSHGAFGWGVHEAGHGLVFANAARPLDAPAAAPLAAHGDYAPLLLLQGASAVPAALTHYLSDIEPGYTEAVPPVREVYNHGWLIGDEHAISARAQAELDTVLEIAPRQPSQAEQSVSEAE